MIWQVVIPCISAMVGSVLGCLTVIALDGRRSPFRQLSARRERRIKRSIRQAVDRAAREIQEQASHRSGGPFPDGERCHLVGAHWPHTWTHGGSPKTCPGVRDREETR